MRLSSGSEDALNARRHTGLVGGALQHAGPHPGIANAALDIAHEHFNHDLGASEHGSGTAVVEIVWDVVVRIDARGHDDLDGSLLGDSLDARDVASEAEDREVD